MDSPEMKLSSEEIRQRSVTNLKLPKTPSNLKSLKKPELIQLLDEYNDYWSTWLRKATMFPEYPPPQDYTPGQLRKLITIASNDLAQEAFKYLHDYKTSPELHQLFYLNFFKEWNKVVWKLSSRYISLATCQ